MSGKTLTCDLAGGYRLIVTEARIEDGAFIGEAAILDAHDRECFENFVTIDQSGALGFEATLPDDLPKGQLRADLITALLEWGLDPLATLQPPVVSPPYTLDLAGGETLHARDIRRSEDGRVRAHLTRRDANGNLRHSRLAVFDNGPEEFSARKAFNLDSFSWEIVERQLGALALGPAAPASRIVRAGDMVLAEPDWLIAGILPRTGLTLLVGKEASYKSFVALGMAGAILTGVPWIGNDVARGPVLYLAGEGEGGIKRRVRAWEIAHGLSLDELLILPRPVNLLDAASLAALEVDIASLDPAPVAIVVDTLARYYHGDENATADMGRFVEACDGLKRRTGAQVVIVHHLNKVGEFRGNTALVAAVDTRIDAKRDGTIVALSCAKQKDWQEFTPLQLVAYPVDLGLVDQRGMAVSSLVMQPADADALREAKREATQRQPLTDTDRRVLDILHACDSLTASAWQSAAEQAGVSRPTFYRARDRLQQRELITLDGEGRGARYASVSSLTSVSYQSHAAQAGLVSVSPPFNRG